MPLPKDHLPRAGDIASSDESPGSPMALDSPIQPVDTAIGDPHPEGQSEPSDGFTRRGLAKAAGAVAVLALAETLPSATNEALAQGAGNPSSPRGFMTRAELTEKIVANRILKGLTWKKIAETVGGDSLIFITSALLGQQRLSASQAKTAAELLGLGKEGELLLQQVPYRGSLPAQIPTDPLIYRFYELLVVNGTTWKAVIEEEFGDGIMSAIDFDLKIERLANPAGDRVKFTFSGKFLPFKRY